MACGLTCLPLNTLAATLGILRCFRPFHLVFIVFACISIILTSVPNTEAANCYPSNSPDAGANIGFQYVAQGCTAEGRTIYARYDLNCLNGSVQAINESMGQTPRSPDEMQSWITGYFNWMVDNGYLNSYYRDNLKLFRSTSGASFVLVMGTYATIPGSYMDGKILNSYPYWPTYNAVDFGRFEYPQNPSSSPCCLSMGTPSAPESFKPSMDEKADISANITSNYPIAWSLAINGATNTGSGSLNYSWDGKNNGIPVSTGIYSASITATSAACTATASVSTKVIEPPDKCKLNVPIGSSANVATGNLSFSQDILSVNGGVQPLLFSLHYNSLDAVQGPLGIGWKHNYAIRLQSSDNNGKVFDNGGTRHVFTWNGSTYSAETGDSSSLIQNGDSFDLIFVDGRQYHFASDGTLNTISDKYGNTLTFTYNGTDLVSVSDSLRSIVFDYDPAVPHRLTGVSDPNNNTYNFVYQNDKLWKVVNPVTDTGIPAGYWEYLYNPDNLLQSKTDPGGNTTQYGYSGKKVNSSIAPDLKARGIVYPAETGNVRTSTYTDNNMSQWLYTYDIQTGFIKEKGLAGGKKTSYYYNADTTLRAKTEPFDNNYLTTFYTYDNHGNLLTQTDPVDISAYTGLDPQTVDMATLASLSPPIKTALRYTYDAANFDQIASVTDERFTPFRTNTYQYTTENGQKVTTTTDPEGKQSITRFNANGTVSEVEDGNGKKTIYTYYPDTPENRSAGIVGLLQSVTTPDTIVTNYTSYDKNGNALEIKVKDATQRELRTVYAYDALNRLRTVTRYGASLPDNITRYSYDANGNRTSVKDPESNETKYLYNYQRQVTKVTDARLKDTLYEYGSNSCPSCGGSDKLTAVIDARTKKTSYQYDAQGRLERETDPLGKVIRYTYYDSGLLKEKIDATVPTTELVLITHYYNTLGQLTKKHYADGTEASFTYYPDGALLTASNQNISYTYSYYNNGWLKSVSDSNGRTITYDLYDNIGQRKTVVYFPSTADQRTIQYQYDTANRLDSITSAAGLFHFGYDDLSRIKTVSYPNQIVANFGYDDFNRLTSLNHTTATGTITSYSYTHDQAGNRKTKTGTTNENYNYDELYRLTQAVTPRGTEKYSYDDVGNRTSGPGPRDTGYIHDDANRMLQGRQYSYSYDNNGNQTAKSINETKGWTQSWDYENRLIKSERTKGAEKRTVTFKYDPFGKRIEKKLETTLNGTTTTETTSYVYDNEDIILELITNSAGTTKTIYTHGPGIDEPLALERSGQFYYYHQDGLSSITAISDQNRTVVQRYSYSVFGQPRPTTSFRNSYQYTAREYDKETGLYFYRARYYDPMEGRFISKDPVGFAGGDVNLYGYVSNSPINWIDPFGLKKCGCIEVPVAPAGADIDSNIREARNRSGAIVWFYLQVRNRGPWDYKQKGKAYQDFGNFNFGATGAALGISENILLRGAGWAQQRAGTSKPEYGTWTGDAPYGDDPADQELIQRGIEYYKCMKNKGF